MPDEVDYFSIAKLQLGPGDVLVVRVSGHRLTPELAQRAHQVWIGLLPPQVKMMIVDEGVDLSVLTREDIEARIV